MVRIDACLVLFAQLMALELQLGGTPYTSRKPDSYDVAGYVYETRSIWVYARLLANSLLSS